MDQRSPQKDRFVELKDSLQHDMLDYSDDEDVQLRRSKRERQYNQRLLQNSLSPHARKRIDQLVVGLSSPEFSVRLQSAKGFRMKLAEPINPPIQQVIDSGCLPQFVEFLRDDAHPEIQYESAFVLAKVAAGEASVVWMLIQLFWCGCLAATQWRSYCRSVELYG